MQRKGDQSHHDDHRCEDRDDVTVAPLARASSGPFVAHGWLLVPLNRAHPCLGSERGATSGPGSRSRLCSSRSKSAIRRGMVLGTSDRAASSRATVAWISLIIRCLRADCRVSPVPCLRAMRAPRASIVCGNARTGLFVPKSGSPWEAVRGSPRGNLEPELWLCRLRAMANDPSQELVPCHSKHPRTSKSTPRTV